MTVRNNEDRVGAPIQDSAPVEQMAQSNETFSFATPTEFVDLPTKGKCYPEGHPLYNQETVEIRYMTAKDEDILTSQSLLKKGLAIDRLLQNVIVNKSIKVGELYTGDKNAILIAARITGYGEDYSANLTCPVCGHVERHDFNLSDVRINHGEDEVPGVTRTKNNTFVFELPKSKVSVEVKMITGLEEKKLSDLAEKRKKLKMPEAPLTDQFRSIIVSVNGHTSKDALESFIENMPALDSKYLRGMYARITPNVDMTQVVTCSNCSSESEVQIPFTVDFFWPK